MSDDVAATEAFAESVKERFFNPYLNHQLTSIALNSISKWRARVLPSFRDYYRRHGKIPQHMTIGFSYLMAMYSSRYEELKDEREVLKYFSEHRPLREILSSEELWGEDLTKYAGFYEAMQKNTEKIQEGKSLI